MAFFRHSRTHKSFDLFSTYSYYVPGIGGMFMLLLMLLIGALLGNVIAMAMHMFFPEGARFGMLVSYPVMFIPAMIYASSMSLRNEMFEKAVPVDKRISGGIAKGTGTALAVSAATLAAAIAYDPIGAMMPPMPESLEAIFENMLNGMPLWATLLSVSVFAPFFEEWLCRGMVMRGLLGRMKPVWAIAISALFFAFIHFNPWQALPAFLLGLLFGYVYYRTGSLKLTMLMHCTNNTFSVIIGNIDTLKDTDTFYEAMPLWAYLIFTAVSILVLAATVYWIHRSTSSPFKLQ